MDQQAANRAEVRAFLASRRARITPGQAGLPAGGRRRVSGLRREELAVLAGVSTDWYTRLEKGHIGGVSEDVLDAVARALRLDDDERSYLFGLARASRRPGRASSTRQDVEVPASTWWLLESMSMSSAFVRSSRTDVLAHNALARALLAPMFTSTTADANGRPNVARYVFLDPGARSFFVDWDSAGAATAALLRAAAGRRPDDQGLRDLIDDLGEGSPRFRSMWAAHDVLMHHDGTKRLRHPEVGALDVTFHSFAFPLEGSASVDLVTYTAEPGTASEERLRVLASWAAESSGSPRTAAPHTRSGS